MSALLLSATVGPRNSFVELVNQVGWFMPFLALVVPVSLILLFTFGKFTSALLVVAQLAGIYFSLRPLTKHLRRAGFASFQIKLMLGPCYLIVCFLTNILALLCFHFFRAYF